MSGSKVNNYTQLDTNILELQLTSDANFKGKHLVSLTNYDNTSESKIASGSIIEVAGALYKFTSDETILDTYSVSDGAVYIMIVPATTTCTAVYTNTAPTWDDSKQGWYGTSGTAGYRYLEYLITKSSTSYIKRQFKDKEYLPNTQYMTGATLRNKTYIKAYSASDQTISTSITTQITLGTEEYDTNSEFTSSTFTATKAGYYLINASVIEQITTAVASLSAIEIWKNSARYIRISSTYPPASTTGYVYSNGSAIIYMAVGNTVYLIKRQDTGSSTTIISGSNNTFIEVIEL